MGKVIIVKNFQKAIATFVPEAIYTDRQEHLDYLYASARKAITHQTMSTVLIGQRRMGKTEIFKRVVNRLFYAQDRNQAFVIPVYYSFLEEYLDRKTFAICYIENFLRWIAAFHLKQPELLTDPNDINLLINYIESHLTITKGLHMVIDLLKAVIADAVSVPEHRAIAMPGRVAFLDDIAIAMFLDEFQNTRLPQMDFNIVGFFQESVEYPGCPHFVTGSAMTILTDEILGKGALYGRFDYERIERFTDYYGEELVYKSAQHYGVVIHPEMRPVISDRCGGNPFYITAIIRQAAKRNINIDNEYTLNKILAVDISSGFIWMELSDQVNRWIQRINDYDITKWILYLAANELEPEIDLYRIQQELKKHEFKDIPISKIQEILIKLARGDLIEYSHFGNSFGKINDPILNDFLKVWGEIDILRQKRQWVEEQTIEKYQVIEKRIHEYKGYLAEVYMIQILWNAQRKMLSGKFFNHASNLQMPDQFLYIDQRHRQSAGTNMEVDIYASAVSEIWLAESKWWNKPAGKKVIEHLLKQAEIVKERKGDKLKTLRLWLFSYNGVTRDAKILIQQNNILWSTKDDLNQLLEFTHLRKLPELDT